MVAGGVAANQALRAGADALLRAKPACRFVAPPPKLCTDNGAMIAWAGIERLRLGMIDGLDAPGRAALAARSQIRARAQQQGLKRAPAQFGVGLCGSDGCVLRAGGGACSFAFSFAM